MKNNNQLEKQISPPLLPSSSSTTSNPWYLQDVEDNYKKKYSYNNNNNNNNNDSSSSSSTTIRKYNPLQDELKHTHKKLRHVHNLLQLKTEANLNIMKETSILQTTCAELRNELYIARQTIEKQNDIILKLKEDQLNYQPAGPNATVRLQFTMEKNLELNDIIKDLKAQKETLKVYLAKVDNYSVRVEQENKSMKKQMERLKAIKHVDTQNERHRLDEWKSYVQLMDTKIDKFRNVDKVKQDEIENLTFMLREKHIELDNIRRLTKDTIDTANHTRDEYIVQMKKKNEELENAQRKEKLLTDIIHEHEIKHKNMKINLKKKQIIIDMLEKDLLKSEKLVGKHERVIIALQEEITLLVDKLSPKFEIKANNININTTTTTTPPINTSTKQQKSLLKTNFCVKVFIDSDRVRIDDEYKDEVVHELKQQLIKNDVEIDNLWFPEGRTDGYDSGEVVMTLFTKHPRVEEDIHKLFVRLQKNNFPDVIMKSILPPIAIAWWSQSDVVE